MMTMQHIVEVFLMVLTIYGSSYAKTTSSCIKDCLELSATSVEALRNWLQDSRAHDEVLVRVNLRSVSGDCVNILNTYARYEFFEDVYQTQWVLAKDSKAILLMRLPGLIEMISVRIFPSLVKYFEVDMVQNTSMASSDMLCPCNSCTSQDIVTIFSDKIWSLLKRECTSQPIFKYACYKDDILACWSSTYDYEYYHIFDPIRQTVYVFAYFCAIMLPGVFVYLLHNKKGTFIDKDGDNCLGLDVYPFPVSVPYWLLFWTPSTKAYKCVSHLVYVLRVLFLSYVGVLFGFETLTAEYYAPAPGEGLVLINGDYWNHTFLYTPFLYGVLLMGSIFVLATYSTARSYMESVEAHTRNLEAPMINDEVSATDINRVSTTGEILNTHANSDSDRINSSSEDKVLLHDDDYIKMLDKFLFKPKIQTSSISCFAHEYVTWLFFISSRRKYLMLLSQQNHCQLSLPRKVAYHIMWAFRALLSTVIFLPLVSFTSWILDAFHLKCCKFLSRFHIGKTMTAVFFFANAIVVDRLEFVLKSPYGIGSTFVFFFEVSYPLTVIILILQLYISSKSCTPKCCRIKQTDLHQRAVKIRRLVHALTLLRILLLWLPPIANSFNVLILSPFWLLIVLLLYPELVITNYIFAIALFYVVVKSISRFSNEYLRFFRKVVNISQKVTEKMSNKRSTQHDSVINHDAEQDLAETSGNTSTGINAHIEINNRTMADWTKIQSNTSEQKMPYIKSRIFWAMVKKHKPLHKSVFLLILKITIPSAVLIIGQQILCDVGELHSLGKIHQIAGMILISFGIPMFKMIFKSKQFKKRRRKVLEHRLREDIPKLLAKSKVNDEITSFIEVV